MACPEEKYCAGCEKPHKQFTNSQPGSPQLVCDECLRKEADNRRAQRLSELRIIAQDWQTLAGLLLDLEERVRRLEPK